MPKRGQNEPSPKIRPWRYLPILIILGLAVHLLLPQITALEESWAVVQHMRRWAVILAAIAQVLSYAGAGFTLHAILDNNQQSLSTARGALITMASASIGLVAGGWVGAAAATYSWIRRESRDGNTATLAGTLPAMLNNAVLVSVAVIGLIHLLIVHELSEAQLIGFSVVLLAICLITVGAVAGLRYPAAAIRPILWLARWWAKLRRQPFDRQGTMAGVRQFARAWESLGRGRWHRPVLGAIANMGFDILTLYFLFLATGYRISLGVLFAGYGLPFMLGKLAFLFPGGVGVMEASMVAVYSSLSVPAAVSVVAVLGYRLFSFWLPSLVGFAAAAHLQRLQPETHQA